MDVVLFKSLAPRKEASCKLAASKILRFNEGEMLEVPVSPFVKGLVGAHQGSCIACRSVPRVSVKQVPLPSGFAMVKEGVVAITVSLRDMTS